jgi:hypothetical protein
MRYDPRSATEIRSRLRLRSTCPGANNRLDIQALVSWDRQEGQALPMMDLQPDEEAGEGAEQQQHRRGMSPYVFGEGRGLGRAEVGWWMVGGSAMRYFLCQETVRQKCELRCKPGVQPSGYGWATGRVLVTGSHLPQAASRLLPAIPSSPSLQYHLNK